MTDDDRLETIKLPENDDEDDEKSSWKWHKKVTEKWIHFIWQRITE